MSRVSAKAENAFTNNTKNTPLTRNVFIQEVRKLEKVQKELVQKVLNGKSNTKGLQNQFNQLTTKMRILFSKYPTRKHSGGGKRRTHRRKRV